MDKKIGQQWSTEEQNINQFCYLKNLCKSIYEIMHSNKLLEKQIQEFC